MVAWGNAPGIGAVTNHFAEGRLYLWSVPQAEAPGYMHLPLLSEKKLILDNDHRIRSHADEFRARPFPVSDVRRRFVTLIAAG